MDNIFNSKTIVVTGASSGVGRAIALELASHGAKLVLAARRLEPLEELVIECTDAGGTALPVKTDMRSVDDIRQLAEIAYQFGGSIDVWVNNAGVLAAGALEEVPPEVNEAVIKVNLLGYMHSAQVVLPYFKQQRHGILINNISVGGWMPTPYSTAYTASKFGLRGFSEALKGELKGWPAIHVCDLYPGFLDTPGMQHAANYTGRALKPVPPVYAPQKVARAVVKVIQSPASKTTVGLTATLLRLGWLVFPRITRAATVAVIRSYLKRAPVIENTSGNVLHPVGYGTSIEGGWQKPVINRKAVKTAVVAAGITGLLVGCMLAVSKSNR